MHTIAIDVHISTLEFAVINQIGKVVAKEKISTSEKGMINFIKTIPKPRKIFIEEGTLSSWVVETCHEHGESIIVTDPKRNRWISNDDHKNDEADAIKLARLCNMEGYIKEIHHSVGQRKRFRELVAFYHDTIKSQTRVKNKIKCKFRQYGILSEGKTIYDKKYQSLWLKKLPKHPMIHFMIQRLWDQLEKIQDNAERTEKILNKQSKLYKEINLFQQIPGIGPIHSATISAILENPYRFSKKSRLWKYSGLGIVCKGSGGKLYSEKLSKDYNRLLKYTIKQAALSAIKSKPNIFKNKYYTMLNNGVNPSRALLTLARSMLTTMWTMWKKGENFNPKIIKENIGI